MSKDFNQRLKTIDANLNHAISKGQVKLVAVSKYAEDEELIAAYNSGLRIFGENYVLPALKRKERLANIFKEKVEWHLLGPLQSNKVNKAVGNFDLIQSVDDLEIAELINARAKAINIKQKILMQINLTGDKSGFSPEEFNKIYPEIEKLDNLELCGLMTMGPHNISEKSETIFETMRQLKMVLERGHPFRFFELSMGMTNDYQIAVQYGATMIRLGRGLFGHGANKIQGQGKQTI